MSFRMDEAGCRSVLHCVAHGVNQRGRSEAHPVFDRDAPISYFVGCILNYAVVKPFPVEE